LGRYSRPQKTNRSEFTKKIRRMQGTIRKIDVLLQENNFHDQVLMIGIDMPIYRNYFIFSVCIPYDAQCCCAEVGPIMTCV
jgi:hypothetical protein